MDLRLSGRVAVVLGAGGGIGGGIAEALAAEGATVACVDRDFASAQTRARQVETEASQASPFAVELGDHEAEARMIAEVEAALGPVEVLVNNTGGPPSTTVSGVELDTWLTYCESMITSVIHVSDMVLPGMRERGWGRVVTSTSSGVIVPIPMLGISNTLRSSLMGWSKTLASEAGADGVTCNVVVPGRIGSQRAIELDEKRAVQQECSVEEVRAAYFDRIPARRYGTPREYGDVVAFLASDRAAYINGSVWRIDGGMIERV